MWSVQLKAVWSSLGTSLKENLFLTNHGWSVCRFCIFTQNSAKRAAWLQKGQKRCIKTDVLHIQNVNMFCTFRTLIRESTGEIDYRYQVWESTLIQLSGDSPQAAPTTGLTGGIPIVTIWLQLYNQPTTEQQDNKDDINRLMTTTIITDDNIDAFFIKPVLTLIYFANVYFLSGQLKYMLIEDYLLWNVKQ